MTVEPDLAIRVLNEALQAKFHSLARYILESSPYATRADAPLVEALERIAAEDEAQAREITAQIEALDGIPATGLPDPMVTEIAYLAVGGLARQCAEGKRQEAARMRRSLEALGGNAGPGGLASAQALLQRLAEADLGQAEALEKALEVCPEQRQNC